MTDTVRVKGVAGGHPNYTGGSCKITTSTHNTPLDVDNFAQRQTPLLADHFNMTTTLLTTFYSSP